MSKALKAKLEEGLRRDREGYFQADRRRTRYPEHLRSMSGYVRYVIDLGLEVSDPKPKEGQ